MESQSLENRFLVDAPTWGQEGLTRDSHAPFLRFLCECKCRPSSRHIEGFSSPRQEVSLGLAIAKVQNLPVVKPEESGHCPRFPTHPIGWTAGLGEVQPPKSFPRRGQQLKLASRIS